MAVCGCCWLCGCKFDCGNKQGCGDCEAGGRPLRLVDDRDVTIGRICERCTEDVCATGAIRALIDALRRFQ